jgi:hypothetical protein
MKRKSYNRFNRQSGEKFATGTVRTVRREGRLKPNPRITDGQSIEDPRCGHSVRKRSSPRRNASRLPVGPLSESRTRARHGTKRDTSIT